MMVYETCDNCGKRMDESKYNSFGDNVCSKDCNLALISKRRLKSYGFEDEYKNKTLDLFDFSAIDVPKYNGSFKSEILKYVKNPDRTGWYLNSKVGRGKSHLALAMTREIVRNFAWRAIIIHTVDFMNSLKSLLQHSQDIEGPVHTAKIVTLLVLDDIGIEMSGDPSKTKFSRDTMFDIIDHRCRRDLPMIITSNFKISEFPDERIASRLVEKCRVRELIGTDYRIKLNKKLEVV